MPQRSRRWHSRLLAYVAAGLLGFGAPTRAPAGEAYYLLVYASQRVPNNPDYSHTFATFVRLSWAGDGPCPAGAGLALEAHTISWLPVSGAVHTLRLRPEPGRNYGLHESIRLALATGQRVSLWGPYQVRPELYALALRRTAELECGGVRYVANDMLRRSDRVSNCIHAVSAVADGRRLRVGSPGWGQVASFAVLRRFEPWVLDRDRTHDWLVGALGLDAYPIYYRAWAPPYSGALLGPAYRLLGGERDLAPSYGPPAARGRRAMNDR